METITKKNAMRALREHGNNSYSELKDFVKILGNKQAYKLQDIKWWLGY
jgi:hypothetical protein